MKYHPESKRKYLLLHSSILYMLYAILYDKIYEKTFIRYKIVRLYAKSDVCVSLYPLYDTDFWRLFFVIQGIFHCMR